jgi:hypothetical protein
MTVDEELSLLDESLRRLKIEYDIFFHGHDKSKKPPIDLEWSVNTILKRLNDGVRLSCSQRYRYNAIAQKYAIFKDLWRQKMKIKEEGARRPQDVMLGVVGAAAATRAVAEPKSTLRIERRLTIQEEVDPRPVEKLFEALNRARSRAGLPPSGELASFQGFVSRKTAQLRQDYGCRRVEYTIEVEGKEVRLKARAFE